MFVEIHFALYQLRYVVGKALHQVVVHRVPLRQHERLVRCAVFVDVGEVRPSV